MGHIWSHDNDRTPWIGVGGTWESSLMYVGISYIRAYDKDLCIWRWKQMEVCKRNDRRSQIPVIHVWNRMKMSMYETSWKQMNETKWLRLSAYYSWMKLKGNKHASLMSNHSSSLIETWNAILLRSCMWLSSNKHMSELSNLT